MPSTKSPVRRSSRKSHHSKYYAVGAKISNPAIKRLAYVAGTKRVAADVYDNVRYIIHEKLQDIVKKLVILVENAGKKTLTLNDLKYVVESDRKLYGSGEYVICKNKKSIDKHKGNCVVIGKLPFSKMVRGIVQQHSSEKNFRATSEFLENLQYYVERYLIDLISIANVLATTFESRQTLKVRDLKFVVDFHCKM